MVDNELKQLIDKTLLELDTSVGTIKAKESGEEEFLISIKTRLLIFFEALQSKDLLFKEEKFDVTINFLEYLLSLIEDRLKKI